MVKFLRYMLLPVSFIYGGIVAMRNLLFNAKILKSSEFDVKTILVGNLSMGGTGKTPHVEYLIRLLKDKVTVSTLSRGYGRKSHGFNTASIDSTAKDVGDEPLQFKRKFPEIEVHVDAKRVNGIIEIMSQDVVPDVILLDDAFQHRALKAGFSVLLTDYNSPFYSDIMLPTGDLREFAKGRKRAEVIIVTKCPNNLSESEQSRIINKIKPFPHQSVFFTKINYGNLRSIWTNKEINLANNQEIILITGIANPKPLVKNLSSSFSISHHFNYPDHHPFSSKNIQEIKSTFDKLNTKEMVILTTEKDAMRLISHKELCELPIYYLEIEIEFISRESEFNKLINSYVGKN